MAFRVHAVDKDYALFSQHLPNMMHGVAATHSLPPPLSDGEAIRREIIKEKIRQEILAKEMLERKILEEEVRRELEIERIRELRRFHMERFSMHASNTDMIVHGNRPTQSFMPAHAYARTGACLRQESVHDPAEFAFRDRSSFHLLQKKPVVHPADSSLHHKLEKDSPSEETKTLDFKLSGAKRKASGPAEKQWGCAACKVKATSKRDLNRHLQGKMHKKNESLQNLKTNIRLQSSKKNMTHQPKGASSGELENKKQEQMKGASVSTPAPAKEHRQKFCCGLCNVKCNSLKMMEGHCNGKRHKACIELEKDGKKLEKDIVKDEEQMKNTEDGEVENTKQVQVKGASNTPVKEHRQKLYCGLCKVKCNSLKMMEVHYNGKRHKASIIDKERQQQA